MLAEVLTWFAGSGPAWRALAVKAVRGILDNPNVKVLPQTSSDFYGGISFYESRLDKEYSLVDCRSMNAMRSLGLADVLTNDRHFAQEGFTILFP